MIPASRRANSCSLPIWFGFIEIHRVAVAASFLAVDPAMYQNPLQQNQIVMANNVGLDQLAEKRANRNLWTATWIAAGALILIAIISWVVFHIQNTPATPGVNTNVPASAEKK